MNRLVLIGNGFDLAHKLKTSYSDFIKDYLKNVINHYYQNNVYQDDLIEISNRYVHNYFENQNEVSSDNAMMVLRSFQFGKEKAFIMVKIKSAFFHNTLDKLENINWVDLEDDYFNNLLACKSSRGFNLDKVKSLNDEFDFLKLKLEEYLIKVQKENEHSASEEISEVFCEKIKGKDIVTLKMNDELPSRILILSFNYTDTLEKYKKACQKCVDTQINYIHGKLEANSNPLIFGYGDEYNKSYLEFEDLKKKELLKHIKSFGYFKTSNYHNLIRFIEEDNFQVYILGHSLGLSDRTMLKQIFEHDKCKSIKFFYHKLSETQNDYTDKTFDISSHFSDKALMRKKIVPFDLSSPMPQPTFTT